MPSKSKAQHNLMAMVAHDPKAAKRLGIPQSVGRDYVKADKGRKFDSGGMTMPSYKMDRMSPMAREEREMPSRRRGVAPMTMRKGGEAESPEMVKKEVAFMKKKGAPKSMIRHEEEEIRGGGKGKIKKFAGGRMVPNPRAQQLGQSHIFADVRRHYRPDPDFDPYTFEPKQGSGLTREKALEIHNQYLRYTQPYRNQGYSEPQIRKLMDEERARISREAEAYVAKQEAAKLAAAEAARNKALRTAAMKRVAGGLGRWGLLTGAAGLVGYGLNKLEQRNRGKTGSRVEAEPESMTPEAAASGVVPVRGASGGGGAMPPMMRGFAPYMPAPGPSTRGTYKITELTQEEAAKADEEAAKNKSGKYRGGKIEGKKMESRKMMKKEVAFMKKKGAPKSMVKHEEAEYGMKRGGMAGSFRHAADGVAHKGKTKGRVVKMREGGVAYSSGGSVYRRAADGIASKGKTKGKMVKMRYGGEC